MSERPDFEARGRVGRRRAPVPAGVAAAAVLALSLIALGAGSRLLETARPTPAASAVPTRPAPSATPSALIATDLRPGTTLLAIGDITMRDGDERLLARKGERLYVVAGPAEDASGDVEVQWFGSLDHAYTPTGRIATVESSELLPRAALYP